MLCFRHFVFNDKVFFLQRQTINLCISTIGQLKLFFKYSSFIFLVFTSDYYYLLYFDILIASNHEFVQSTKEIQVASFYI